ncbi:MAG: hypothetical protein JNK15_07340 [Planctomycetes bacterium]|nr:hypothetical protein [Planctomycetota bacterium]
MDRLSFVVLSFAATVVAQTSPPPTLSLLADLNVTNAGTSSSPGSAAADLHTGAGDRVPFVRFGAEAVFVADNEDTGRELWITDGAAGSWPSGTTRLLRDIRPGTASSNVANLWVHAGYVWFTADDGISGTQLYRSDGTTAGTVNVSGTAPGSAQVGGEFAPLDAQRFFFRSQPVAGGNYNLYLYDQGVVTPQTTAANWCNPFGCTPLPGGIVFRNQRTSQLNFADGTQVTNLSSATGPVAPDKFVRVGSRVLFVARNNPNTTGLELWATSGTVAGTMPLGDLRPGTLSGTNLDVVCVHQGVLYFKGYDALAGSATEQLWRSDGTVAGTWQVSSSTTTPLAGITAMETNGTTLLIGTANLGIFASNGTLAGTSLLMPCRSVSSLNFTAGRFWWQQSQDPLPGFDDALCFSDGTIAGTGSVIAPLGSGALRTATAMVEIAPNTVLLAGDDGLRGTEVWRSDGTLANTQLVADLHGRTWTKASDPSGFAEFAPGRLVFSARDEAHGTELWTTDGTPAGTTMVVDLVPGTDPSTPLYAAALDGFAVFAAYTPTHGRELWRTDGTPGGTSLVLDIWPGATGSGPQYMTRVGDIVYFRADDGVHGAELWVTDGTAVGTHQVADVVGGELLPHSFCELGQSGIVLFNGNLAGDRELWRSDGTALGTYRLVDLSATSSDPYHLVQLGDSILFSADDGVSGYELWRTDGSVAGTYLVEDLYPGAPSSMPSDFAVRDGGVSFVALNPTYGRELWSTDGTALGTSLAIDLVPGTGSMDPQHLVFMGNRHLYFTAQQTGFGREPWVVRDGSPFLTDRIADVRPGSSGSIPSGGALGQRTFTDSLGRMFLAADDGRFGAELWTITQGAWSKAQGRPCGTGMLPRLTATPPVLGQMWILKGSGVTPGTYVTIGLNWPATVATNLGGGCHLHLNAVTLWLFPWFQSSGSQWTQFVNLPSDPWLAGLRFSLQSLHTASGTSFDGFSNGVWIEAGF